MSHILRDRLWGNIRNHAKRVGLVSMPLLCAAVATNIETPFSIIFGTVGSLIALIASEPRLPQPTMGRQLYRTTAYLMTNLEPLIANSRHVPGILFAVEIDGFEQWCNKNGKIAKSKAIIAIYDRLASAVRHDDLVIHTADDRFFIAISMRGVFDINTTISISELLQRAVDPAIILGERPHYFSISIGIADTQMEIVTTTKDLCRAAIVGNKFAQDQGPGNVRFFSQGGGTITQLEHRPTAPELKLALDRGEISAQFQPQICGFTGQVLGFEALARWVRHDGTTVPPLRFLDVLKSSGQLTSLTDIMISQSLNALKNWNSLGLNIETVSVNLSADDLNDPHLVKRVKWHLMQANLLAKHLILEVVESVIVTSENTLIAKNIKGLAALGCRIDLDDFGTGNASIPSLRHLTLHRIKIDRSFLTHCDQDPRQQRLLSAMIAMAHEMELAVVAEGIETIAEQTEAVRQGVDAIQGYAIAKAMPSNAVAAWIKNYMQAKHNFTKSA
jgi:EAL domain-containing protein (putative c-di-GMP-specific phosphodiesterase class I)/GGDEF domain-containing protein